MLLVAAVNNGAYAVEVGGEELGITLDVTYVTRYIWHGYDILEDDKGAWQPSITLSWRRFYFGIWGSWADDSGYVDSDELDYFIGYKRSILKGKRYALDMSAAYTYLDFPRSDSVSGYDGIADGQEVVLGVSMPYLLHLGNASLVPSYEAYFEWDGIQNSGDVDGGWVHKMGLSYDICFPALIANQKQQALILSWDIEYNEGVYKSDSDWSYTTLGLSTSFEWRGVSFTPSFNYQWSFEDTVNEEDEFYASFSLSYRF
jgi:hypothetical protein